MNEISERPVVAGVQSGYGPPQMATADGGVVTQDGTFFDSNLSVTGAVASLPTYSWVGSTYGSGSSITKLLGTPTSYAPTYAATAGGNQSGQGTAIQQVLTNQSQAAQEQLPDLFGATCLSTQPNPLPTCGNINAIELLTTSSLDSIFQTYIQTYRPVRAGTNNNSIMSFKDSTGSSNINVTGPGQTLTITLVPLYLEDRSGTLLSSYGTFRSSQPRHFGCYSEGPPISRLALLAGVFD
jgi:hypothetical protein